MERESRGNPPIYFEVRVTKNFKSALQEAALATGMTASALLRQSAVLFAKSHPGIGEGLAAELEAEARLINNPELVYASRRGPRKRAGG